MESIELMARMIDLCAELINGDFFSGADQYKTVDDKFLVPDNFDPKEWAEEGNT